MKFPRIKFPHWSVAPPEATPLQRQNFLNVQVDGIGIGLAAASNPFLPVFLARLGATSFQVGLLTSMPAFTGLLLSLVVGRFLQGRRQVLPWYSLSRFCVALSFALTGLIPFIVPRAYAAFSVLGIWALATLPLTIVQVGFAVVMNAVAGPKGRYELMSRRWFVLGLTSAVATFTVSMLIDRLAFPVNYQLVFISLSAGGLISLMYSLRIQIPDNPPVPPEQAGLSLRRRLAGYLDLMRSHPAFVAFSAKRLVYLAGVSMAIPVFPLYFVRQAHLSDKSISQVNFAFTALMLVGYILWVRLSKKRGSRFTLLGTTLGLACYPALTALMPRPELLMLAAGLGGLFQAGLDLVFFDELMNTVPSEHSAIFVSVAQSLQNLAAVVAPLLGTWLADVITPGGALCVCAAVRLIGFGLFAWPGKRPAPAAA